MKCYLPSAFLGLALFFVLSANAQEAEYIRGDIMVMMAPGVPAEKVAEDLRLLNGVPTGLRVAREISAPMRAWLLQFDTEEIHQQVMLRAINSHRDVQLAQNNHIIYERDIPNDTQYGQQWHHQNIESETAWDITTGGITATGDTIVVCIIENSDLPHPDLIDNAWFNHNEIPNNGIDDDGNGYVDDYRGWNTPGNNDNVYGGSHGTQVAGMIGAKGNNGLGVAGANWDVKMMVVEYGGTQEAAVVAAYTYPLVMRRLYNQTNGAEGAFVVATNASWGINNGQPSNSPMWCAMYDTLGTAGILSCGATANNNVNIDVVGDLPTACPSEHLVSVTATNNNDMRTFSAWGSVHVDLGAPGDNVRTTSIGGGYGNASGTSFASPLTAGVIGLLYSAPCASMMDLVRGDPSAGALFIRDALFDGVDQVGNLPGNTATGGRVNMTNSLNLIMASCGACPAPYNLTAVPTDLTTSDLSWSAVSGDLFSIRYRPVGTAVWTEVNGLDDPEYTASGLMPCTLYEFQVSAGCDEENSDFSSSLMWTTEGCCSAPADQLMVDGITDSTATINWEEVLAAADYAFRYREVGTSTWTTISSLTGSAYTITGLEACTSYEIQGQSNCTDSVSTWSPSLEFNVLGCGACADHAYCPSVSEDSEAEYIANVTIANIDNDSGDDGGYGDYTHMSAALTIGNEYSISLTPGYGTSWTYQEHFRVYIDLDQDGDFNSPGELVYDAPQTTNTTITGTITIPNSATPGLSRMRVVMRYSQPVQSACVNEYDYGETEDYCLELFMLNVGVQELSGENSINVYPDPADHEITFDITGDHANEVLMVSMLDNTGREVGRERIENGRATIGTSFLSNGLYIYRILQQEQEIGRGKFIIAH